jgi:hypothetical protein
LGTEDGGQTAARQRTRKVMSRAGLTALAGVDVDEIDRLLEAGVLVLRGDDLPFRAVDVLMIRVARACEEGGLPIEAIAGAINPQISGFEVPQGRRPSCTRLVL